MELKADMNKQEYLVLQSFVVEKTIELSKEYFKEFYKNLWDEYLFVIENSDCCCENGDGKAHCLLVLQEGEEDGILVDTKGD